MSPPRSTPCPEAWLELPDGQMHWLRERCAIGRQLDNDLVLDFPGLSRHHALLTASGGHYLLSDLHSRNGTQRNQLAVTRPVPLADGDEIRFGDIALRFRCQRAEVASAAPIAGGVGATQRIDQVRERECVLLLADVVGYAALNERLGSEVAVRQMQTWIAALRPLIERNGGVINGYLGDAIFAYWLCASAQPAQVRTALQAIEGFRAASPLPFRVVAHCGAVLFTHSDRGEELTGQQVNFVFRSEKLAKRFNTLALLSEPAVAWLELESRCPRHGAAKIDGMVGTHAFYGLPADFAAATTA